MPMYFDLEYIARPRRLTRWHVELACELLMLIRRQHYGDRGDGTPINMLAPDDVTDNNITIWALTRRWMSDHIAHVFFHHKKGMADHGGEGLQHGHPCPLISQLSEMLWSKPDFDSVITPQEFARAKRDLEGLLGMCTSMSHTRLSPEEVFARDEW